MNIPGRPTFSDDMRVRVWFDSDNDAETGLTPTDLAGRDYFILWDRDGANLLRCRGSSCSSAAPHRTFSHSYRDGATFTVSAVELGETTAFRFTVEAAAGIAYDAATRRFDFSKATWDYAPAQDRFWSYVVRLGPSRLLVKSFSTTPARPKAGRTLSVRLAATRADTGTLVSSGRVVCAARIGRKLLKPRSQGFSGRRATCAFAIPPGTIGKMVRGAIAVVFEGKRVSKRFSRRIG